MRDVLLRAAPWLTAALFLGPIGAGLAGTLLPAFGWLPALGGVAFSLEPWRMLLAAPGLPRAVLLTLVTGFAATLLSFCLVVAFCAATQGSALVLMRLSDAERDLSALARARGVRTHRSWWVNLDHVTAAEKAPGGGATLMTRGGVSVPVSRGQRAAVMEALAGRVPLQ